MRPALTGLLVWIFILMVMPGMTAAISVHPGSAPGRSIDPAALAADIDGAEPTTVPLPLDFGFYAPAEKPAAFDPGICLPGGDPVHPWAHDPAAAFFFELAKQNIGSLCIDSGRTIPHGAFDHLLNEQGPERTFSRLSAGMPETIPVQGSLPLVLLGLGLILTASLGRRFFKP